MIAELDRRAFAVGFTLSELAGMAGVSSATMAKLRRGEPVLQRSVTKLEAKLDELEASK